MIELMLLIVAVLAISGFIVGIQKMRIGISLLIVYVVLYVVVPPLLGIWAVEIDLKSGYGVLDWLDLSNALWAFLAGGFISGLFELFLPLFLLLWNWPGKFPIKWYTKHYGGAQAGKTQRSAGSYQSPASEMWVMAQEFYTPAVRDILGTPATPAEEGYKSEYGKGPEKKKK